MGGSRRTLYNSQYSIVKNKILYMYIFRPNGYTSTTFISMMDEFHNYIEYELTFLQNDITYTIAGRLRSLFGPYQFTKSTEVVVDKDYDKRTPIYLYLMFIKQQIQFDLRSTTLDVIIRRIVFRHKWRFKIKSKDINKQHLMKVWDKLIKTGKCQWVTSEVEYEIQNYPLILQPIKRTLRLAMHYLVAKSQITTWNRTSKKRQLENLTLYDN